MTIAKVGLNDKLLALKNEFKGFRALQKLTNKQEYSAIAKIYLWWRNARTEPGYLDECYESAGINSPKLDPNSIDFKPLLLLVNNKQIAYGDQWQWNIGLNCIHDAFESNPDHYAQDPAWKIEKFIGNSGGKTGLVHKKVGGKLASQNAQSGDELKAFTLDDSEFGDTFIAEAKFFVTAKSNKLPVPLPALPVTLDGFSVVLLQNGANGAELIGSSNDEQAVKKLLVDLYRNEFDAMPATMRCVIEPLHILNVPNSIAVTYGKHLAGRKQGPKKNAVGGKASEFKRLIYRPYTSDFLLSSTKRNASVVVIAKPKPTLIDRSKGDIWMPIQLRKSIESNLLHKAMCNMFTPSHVDTYTTCPPDSLVSHIVYLNTKLKVEDDGGVSAAQLISNTGNLHHAPLHFMPFFDFTGPHVSQVTATDSGFKPTWNASVDAHWLNATTTNFFAEWMAAYVKKTEQAKHKTMQVELSAARMVVSYEYNPQGGHEIPMQFDLPAGSASGSSTLNVRSFDFVCVMRQLADLNVLGQIKFDADSHAMRLTFSTAANNYVCWVPAADIEGKRDATHFVPYSPIQTVYDGGPDDQDPDPNLIDDELAQFAA